MSFLDFILPVEEMVSSVSHVGSIIHAFLKSSITGAEPRRNLCSPQDTSSATVRRCSSRTGKILKLSYTTTASFVVADRARQLRGVSPNQSSGNWSTGRKGLLGMRSRINLGDGERNPRRVLNLGKRSKISRMDGE